MATAKARFSELVARALAEGPQHVTRHGRPAVVVAPETEWMRLSSANRSRAEVIFDPSVRGLLTNEECDELFARDKSLPGDIEL